MNKFDKGLLIIDNKNSWKEININNRDANIKLPLLTLFLSLILTIFFLNFIPNISADVISINSGGSEQIVINPDAYIEGFFTGKVFQCGDGIIDTEIGETCDDGNTVSGDGCSSACITEVPVTPLGGGGGGGGGEGVTLVTCNIMVNPSVINLNLQINTNEERTISVTNNGPTIIKIIPKGYTFTNVIFDPVNFSLGYGETKELNVTFVASDETGVFTGTIQIGCAIVSEALNIKTALLLFDSNIVVLNKDYIVVKGDELRTRVTLIPLGDKERLDVTLDYTIRDYTGRVYITQRETLLIEDRINFDRNFGTGSLPIGRYVVGLELRYPGGVAPSSAHFEVISRAPITFGTIVLWLITMIILIAIIIIIILIYKRRKKKEEENVTET